jgi:hypothetical protein
VWAVMFSLIEKREPETKILNPIEIYA